MNKYNRKRTTIRHFKNHSTLIPVRGEKLVNVIRIVHFLRNKHHQRYNISPVCTLQRAQILFFSAVANNRG